MNYFSEMFDLFDSVGIGNCNLTTKSDKDGWHVGIGNCNLTTKSDKDGWHLTYDFQDEDGKNASIHADGEDFLSAAENLIQKTSDGYDKQEVEEDDDDDIALDELSKEELIDIILEQTDVIEDYDTELANREAAYDELAHDYQVVCENRAFLEEKIDDLYIELNKKTKIIDAITSAIG